jgi:hypothetical protein
VADGRAEEEVMKADALMRFVVSGNRSLEEFAILLARISLGVFFAISGGNKLFVARQYKLMYETIVGAGIPFSSGPGRLSVDHWIAAKALQRHDRGRAGSP